MKLRLVLGLLSAVCTLALAEAPKTAPATYAPLPEAVTSFGAVAHGGWVYIYGGHLGPRHEYSSNEVTGVCRRLSLMDGVTWETLASDVPAQSPGVVAKGKYLYRIGGMAARNPKGEKQDTFSHDSAARLDLLSNKWEPLPNLPEPRSSHDAWIVGNKIYVAGGWKMQGKDKKSEWLDSTLALDLSNPDAKWERIDQPFKRRGICMAAVGTKLYCIGGMDDEDATSSKVDVLDTATGKWSVGPVLPPARFKGFAASACIVDGRLYFNGFSGVVYRLSSAGDAWEEVGKVPTPRLSHRILPASPTRLIAIGGEGMEGKVSAIEIVELGARSAQVSAEPATAVAASAAK